MMLWPSVSATREALERRGILPQYRLALEAGEFKEVGGTFAALAAPWRMQRAWLRSSREDVRYTHVADRVPHPIYGCDDEVALVGSCYAFAIVPACQVKDFYRGYALVAGPAIAIAAVAQLVLELLS